ncbi:hypothetical protein Tco_1054039 [Tanacetum coccineum]|uniref:Uncharacterized protein n=1 Tax=Tanacetum coccineum TaxID=301880 RepID=A0ABQ5GVM8_9ASTR
MIMIHGRWEMEHYLEYIDNEVWKVTQNGNSKKRVTKGKDGVYRVLPPTTQEEQFADEKERKARTLLLMAVPKDHLRRFSCMDVAKDGLDDIDEEPNSNWVVQTAKNEETSYHALNGFQWKTDEGYYVIPLLSRFNQDSTSSPNPTVSNASSIVILNLFHLMDSDGELGDRIGIKEWKGTKGRARLPTAWTNTNRVNKANSSLPGPCTIGSLEAQLYLHVSSGTHVNSSSLHVNSGTKFKSGASRFIPWQATWNLKSPKKCFSKQRSPVNRPFSRYTAYKSNKYDVKGKMGTAVKTSAGHKATQSLLHLARRSPAEGGDSEIGGDGDGVVMARSLSTFASGGKDMEA